MSDVSNLSKAEEQRVCNRKYQKFLPKVLLFRFKHAILSHES